MERLEDIGWRRGTENSLKFAMKKIATYKTQTEKPEISSSDLQQIILTSKELSDFIKQVSKEQDVSESELIARVKKILTTVEFNNYTVIYRLFVLFLMPLTKLLVSGCYLSESALLKLRNEMGNNPVIFLPTHRSFADIMTVCYLCYEYDIEMCTGVVGIDYSRCWCMARLMRDAGAIFMRRSFKTDKLYSFVFKTFFQKLVKESGRPFTLFIEGTRSKNGKSRMSKLGLLKLIVDLYASGHVADVTLATFSIAYDSVLEDEIIAFDVFQRYRPKSLLKILDVRIDMLLRPFGMFYVNCSEPISLKQYSRQCNNEFNITDLTNEIMFRQKRYLVLTCFNLLSVVMTNHLYGTGTEWLNFNDAVLKTRQLKYLLKRLGAVVGFKDDEELFEIKRVIAIHRKHIFIDENDRIRIRFSSTYHHHYPHHKSSLSDSFETDWIPLMILQYYANYCLPYLINPALIIAILSSSASVPFEQLYSSYQFMRKIFEDEFAFSASTEKSDFDQSLALLDEMGSVIINSYNDSVAVLSEPVDIVTENSYVVLFRRLMKPYLQGVHFICEYMYGNSGETYDKGTLVKRLQRYIERRIRYCELNYFSVYSISSCFIENELTSFAKAGFIIADQNPTSTYRCDDAAKIYEIINIIKCADPECANITDIPSDFPSSLSRY